MLARLAVLVLLMAAPLAAQEPANPEKLEDLVKRLSSKDPFTAFLARKELDAQRAWALIKGASSPDPFLTSSAGKELQLWACSEPGKARERLAGFREHLDRRIAEEAVMVVHDLDEVLKWLPLLTAFEELQVPSTFQCERISVSGTPGARIPEMPGETNSNRAARARDPAARSAACILAARKT